MQGVITSNTSDAGGMPSEKNQNNIKALQEKADSYRAPDKKSKWLHYFFVHRQPDGYCHGSETGKIRAV